VVAWVLLSVVSFTACSGASATATSETTSTGGRLVWGRHDADTLTNMTANADGSDQTVVLPGVSAEQLKFSPDGSHLALALDPTVPGDPVTTGIASADGSGLHELRIGGPGFNAACIYWSPDADRLACEAWDAHDPSVRGIYTVRSSDGGKLQRLTTGVQVPCGWSPDGSHLAYLQPVHGDEDRSFLHIVATDGSGTSQRVGSQLYSGLWCDWSPVDQTILTEQDGLLWLVSLDGSQTPIDLKLPASTLMRASRPSFSPDGESVVLSGDVGDGQTDIYTARIDGTDVRQITMTPGGEEFADWGP
jgi:hypothetical protein